ncbi:polyprenyl synthetase family protein [Corynebacterium sp. 11A]|uniref:polyprenyl synthetase family protein n=1 Tax=Corynebacterium sp. 11A TaxID=2080510 RepID=UPI00124EEEFE|nr:polyprenyl synthetase family protein [Corynebacterium sp. 11A]
MSTHSELFTDPIQAIPLVVREHLLSYCTQRKHHSLAMDENVHLGTAVLEDFVLSGGKRMRPLFGWTGYMGARSPECPEDIEAVTTALSALEFIQACALIHDDIIDSSDTRRGFPTVHRRVEAYHREQGFSGDAAHFGESLAILLGDMALVYADDMVMDSGLSDAALRRMREPWRAMRHEVIGGQILDITIESKGVEGVEAPMRVNRYKTAAYTIERPLHLGAAIAGANEETIAAYRSYGRDVGIAFQLRDDVLGVFGDPVVTGKPAGDDLREGKRTVLVARTLAILDVQAPQRAARLREGLGQVESSADIQELAEIIADSGAVDEVESHITELKNQALATITAVPAVEGILGDLAERATARRM